MPDRRIGPWSTSGVVAWCTGVATIGGAFAGFIASQAKGSPWHQPLFDVLAAIAAIAFLLLVAAGVAALAAWLHPVFRRPARLITSRWQVTTDGVQARAPALAMEIALPGTTYMRQPGDRPPWVPQDQGAVGAVQEPQGDQFVPELLVVADGGGGVPGLGAHGGVQAGVLSAQRDGSGFAAGDFVGQDELEEVGVGHVLLAGESQALGQGGGELAELERAQGGGEVGAERVGQRRHGVVLPVTGGGAGAGAAGAAAPALGMGSGLAAGGGPGGGWPAGGCGRAAAVAAGGGAGLGGQAALVVAFEVELLFGVLGAGAAGVGQGLEGVQLGGAGGGRRVAFPGGVGADVSPHYWAVVPVTVLT